MWLQEEITVLLKPQCPCHRVTQDIRLCPEKSQSSILPIVFYHCGVLSSGLHWEMRQAWMNRGIWFIYLLILNILSHLFTSIGISLIYCQQPRDLCLCHSNIHCRIITFSKFFICCVASSYYLNNKKCVFCIFNLSLSKMFY